MKNIKGLLAILVFLWITMVVPGCTSDPDMNETLPPNVVLIVSDDQGWGDLSLHDNTNIRTPNIDSIALNGASFSNFFVSPVCSPTRAELLTGRNFMGYK
jgi:arylsulfatase A-like enzyme